MAVQIANPAVAAKIAQLATVLGVTKTAAVEQAVDALLAERATGSKRGSVERMSAILAQLDRIPDLPGAIEPIDWDEHGLPR
jgi:antitoxin VapB